MRLSLAVSSGKINGLIIEMARVSLFALVLVICVVSSVVQVGFVNWSILGPNYLLLTFALAVHVGWFSIWDQLLRRPILLFSGFVLDSVLISILIYTSGINQSLFLVLHLVNILLAGIVCRGAGALTLALFTSIFFSIAALFSPEMKALSFFFLLAINNLAFMAVAALSGYLSEQLQSVGAELKQTGQSLRSAQELNAVLIENIPSGMLSITTTGEIIQCNAAAKDILGFENLTEKNIIEFFPNLKNVDGLLKADIQYRGPSETETKTLGVTASKIFSPELETYLTIVLFDDLTKIRQLEYQARQNEKLAAVGGLAAGIAHEIRNPLAGISGSVEMLSQTSANEDDRKLMKIILREIDRLNNLITEFLDYARPEIPPSESVDLSVVLNEVLELMQKNNSVRSGILQLREYEEGLFVLGHRDKLKQAFLNIILNSYQAMNDSANPSLTVKSVLSERGVEIRIRDTGCGMSDSTKRKMFEPFHTTKVKGTGLGLAVTHKILEGHGAGVVVESAVGVGTEFVLTFALAG